MRERGRGTIRRGIRYRCTFQRLVRRIIIDADAFLLVQHASGSSVRSFETSTFLSYRQMERKEAESANDVAETRDSAYKSRIPRDER